MSPNNVCVKEHYLWLVWWDVAVNRGRGYLGNPGWKRMSFHLKLLQDYAIRYLTRFLNIRNRKEKKQFPNAKIINRINYFGISQLLSVIINRMHLMQNTIYT